MISDRTKKENIRIYQAILSVNPEDIPDKQRYSDFAEFLLDIFGNNSLIFIHDKAMSSEQDKMMGMEIHFSMLDVEREGIKSL